MENVYLVLQMEYNTSWFSHPLCNNDKKFKLEPAIIILQAQNQNQMTQNQATQNQSTCSLISI